jgi:acetyl-CoA carboxylase carboxyl transferase subunit beta|tara:strand:+ start:2899 stop:3744 length:846 start_codon:yes stop_codon:yes gene_type:complete
MNWLRRLIPSIGTFKSKSKVPDGLWSTCKKCESVLYAPELEKSLYVCPKCDYHLRIGARQRLEMFLDNSEFTEIAANLTTKDPLKFKDSKYYSSRVKEAEAATGEKEAILVVNGELDQVKVVVAAFEFRFMGGSMGSVVGEKFVQGIKTAIKNKSPFICFATSGGARMQESMISLMQMAKTSAAIQKLKKEKLPYISVLVDPIYGGVSASIAMLGDINIAEPNALSGFTGRRVIEQTIRLELPDNFQKSEYLLSNGAIDMIVHRKDLRAKISRILKKIYKT